jgi:hypothetical protein
VAKILRKGEKLKIALLIVYLLVAASVVATVLIEKGVEEAERSFETGYEAHEYLWETVLEGAETDKYDKYAIYASRILAVKHPEIYLQGDNIFLEQIMTSNGYQRVYSIDNIHDESFMHTSFGGPPFSFEDVEFEGYEVISTAQLYPENYPLFAYLDRRLFPVSTTLKTWENEITQLELGEQFYFSLKENRGSAGALYIIYCDNEETYLYDNGELTQIKNLTKTEVIKGNPVLILNEENVWYPLMGRDDTTGDPVLNHIVEEYSTDSQTPQLTEFEENAIEILKQITELEDENQILMSELVAAHTEMTLRRSIENYNVLGAAWSELDISPYAYGIFREIYKRANYLSPITAHLAWISGGHERENRIEAIADEYLTHAGSPYWDYKYAHGHIWNCMLIGKTIGESYRTRAGHCVWQAVNISSVLDALNIKNYMIQVVSYHSRHAVTYLPDYGLFASNGAAVPETLVPKWITFENIPPYLGISFVSCEGEWAHPRLYTYFGTISPEESIDVLNFLKEVFHEIEPEIDFRGVAGAYSYVTYSELISGLKEEEWTPLELP